MAGQQPMQLDGAKPKLSNIQGDVILGLMKRTQIFTFFTIKDAANFKQKLKGLQVTSHEQVVQDQDRANAANKDRTGGEQGKIWLPIVQVNIGFAATGLRKLLKNADQLPKDEAFLGGQVKDAKDQLKDPRGTDGRLATWDDAFNHDDIDGVINVTAPDSDLLDERLNTILKDFGTSIKVVTEVQGRARPGNQMGHEHFGFKDGISNPFVIGVNESTTGHGTQDILTTGAILTGYPRVVPQGPDGLADAGKTVNNEPPWAHDGSYMVFRKLQQKVPEFHLQSQTIAQLNPGMTKEMVETRMVGRWPSGAPLVLRPEIDDPDMGGKPDENNEFNYKDQKDLRQDKCPFVAHIRKTNPRDGSPIDRKGGILPRIMIRQGIPYGPETERKERLSGRSEFDRGLCFVAYQSSITERFRFVQEGWANNVRFPPVPADMAAKLDPVAPIGEDPIIGQTKAGTDMAAQDIIDHGPAGDIDPKNKTRFSQHVIPLGGEYFFVPPISALKAGPLVE